MTTTGFNLLAWLTPGIAVILGAGVVIMLLRRWRRPDETRSSASPVGATADESARLEAAIKNDDES